MLAKYDNRTRNVETVSLFLCSFGALIFRCYNPSRFLTNFTSELCCVTRVKMLFAGSYQGVSTSLIVEWIDDRQYVDPISQPSYPVTTQRVIFNCWAVYLCTTDQGTDLNLDSVLQMFLSHMKESILFVFDNIFFLILRLCQIKRFASCVNVELKSLVNIW